MYTGGGGGGAPVPVEPAVYEPGLHAANLGFLASPLSHHVRQNVHKEWGEETTTYNNNVNNNKQSNQLDQSIAPMLW